MAKSQYHSRGQQPNTRISIRHVRLLGQSGILLQFYFIHTGPRNYVIHTGPWWNDDIWLCQRFHLFFNCTVFVFSSFVKGFWIKIYFAFLIEKTAKTWTNILFSGRFKTLLVSLPADICLRQQQFVKSFEMSWNIQKKCFLKFWFFALYLNEYYVLLSFHCSSGVGNFLN